MNSYLEMALQISVLLMPCLVFILAIELLIKNIIYSYIFYPNKIKRGKVSLWRKVIFCLGIIINIVLLLICIALIVTCLYLACIPMCRYFI